ncbi:MAG: hypothetical protein KAU20_00545, partial [Nanoarchaeota archaeon]|nr:hypothetical protein [Nanoarchaeota archaeon]
MNTKEEIWKLIALFCIELIVFLPFYVADVYADSTANGTTKELVINLDVPSLFNKDIVPVSGTVTPNTKVKFYVNENYRGIISMNKTSSGNISFNVPGFSSGNNTLKTVILDSFGKTKEKSYHVFIDMAKPVVELSEIPAVYSSGSLTITGSTNEPVKIDFYLTGISEKDAAPPGKVTSLHSDEIEKNSVEIAWVDVDDSDFDFYIIYRDGIPIGTTVASPYDDDYLVSSGKTYKYEVAAIDTSCNIGEKVSITITTEPNGTLYNETPEAEDIECIVESKQPQLTIDYEDSYPGFEADISLDEGDNEIYIEATDMAGNSVSFKKYVLYDSEPPEFEHTNIDDVSPSYKSDVTIRGKVSEKATVYAYVNDKLDNSAETDDNGNFSIKVRLKRIANYSSERGRGAARVSAELGEGWSNKIVLVAVDRAGLNATEENYIDYLICGYGGDWNIEVGTITPNLLIPRMILEGFAKFAFDIRLKWQGPGEKANVNNIRLRKRPLSAEESKEYDIEWISGIDEEVSYDGKSAYFVVNLRVPTPSGETSLEQENNISEHRLGECSLGVEYGCAKFPFMIEVDYSYEDPYASKTDYPARSGSRKRVETEISETQRQCVEFSIAIDKRFPSDKIPKSFLKDSIAILNDTINLINELLEPIDKAKKWVFIACMGSWAVYFVKRASEWGSCIGVNPSACDPEDSSKQDEEKESSNTKGKRCKRCLKARADTINFFQTSQWLCDRIMCPSVPTIQKYIRDANYRYNEKIEPGGAASHCYGQSSNLTKINYHITRNSDVYKKCTQPNVDGDINAEGEAYSRAEVRPNYKPKVASDATKWGAPLPGTGIGITKDDLISGDTNLDCCEAEYVREYGSACLGMNELKESFCIQYPTKDAIIAANMQGKCGGLGSATRLWRGICTSKNEGEIIIQDTPSGLTKPNYYVIIDKEKVYLGDSETKVERNPKTGLIKRRDEFITETYRLGPPIFTVEDCKDENENYMSYGKSDVSKSVLNTPLRYTDKDTGLSWIYDYGDDQWKTGGSTMTEDDFEKDNKNPDADGTKYKGLIWKLKGEEGSQYWESDPKALKKDEFSKEFSRVPTPAKKRTAANYIPKSVWDIVCKEANEYVVDPTSGLVTSFQCVCLTAMSEYLHHYKIVLVMIRNCFQTILETGDGSAGVCKQVLTVYLCDLIYYAIKCIIEKVGKGPGRHAEVGKGIPGLMAYMSGSGAATQNKIRGRYGASNIYKTMFVEKKLMHSMCLFAFTGDWGLDLDAIIDSEIEVPIETTCVVTGTRRFITKDPVNYGRAEFLYDIGVFIVSGADDLRYRVELVCSGSNQCLESEGFEGGRCDCLLYHGGEQVRGINVGPGRLNQGDSVDEEVFKQFKPAYRYDKVRVMIEYKDNKGEHVSKVCGETNIGRIGGEPPLDCKFDMMELEFSCSYQWGEHGYARFINLKEKEKILCVGDYLELEGQIEKKSARSEKEERMYVYYKLSYGGGSFEDDMKLQNDGIHYIENDDIPFGPFVGMRITD